MTSQGFDGSSIHFPLNPREDIALWLSSIHLPQYNSSFTQAGYHILEDCRGLTEEKLLQLGSFPTGHRRRILCSLEAFFKEDNDNESYKMAEGRQKPVLFPRTIFLKDRKRVTSEGQERITIGENKNVAGTQNLSARTCKEKGDSGAPLAEFSFTNLHTPASNEPKVASLGPGSASMHSSNKSLSNASYSLLSQWENISKEPLPPSADLVPGVKGDVLSEGCPEDLKAVMVDNEIYESTPIFTAAGPRSTRSYKLRHRPVPEIPEQTIKPAVDWSVQVKSITAQHNSTEGPSGSRQKAPLQKTLNVITPYGEVYLNNAANKEAANTKDMFHQELNEKLKQKRLRQQQVDQKEKITERICMRDYPEQCTTGRHDDDDYALLQPCLEPVTKCISSTTGSVTSVPQNSAAMSGARTQEDETYSVLLGVLPGLVQPTVSLPRESGISPYACFYGCPKDSGKMGWLDKLSPHGNRVFQRRWVKFDGQTLSYYNNDKEMYSKGLVSLSAVKQVRSLGENKFEVVTSVRTFVFRAEKEGERQEWLEVLQTALKSCASISHMACKNSISKSGYIELRGHKGRVYLSLLGTKFRLCKTDQDFTSGLAITVVDLNAACVKHVDHRGFEINTPFKSFCFTAESERAREEWIEAVQESIVETLSNYEVAEKIWFNQSNRNCADCRAPDPEWASINLGLVICKMCAGQHRFLGSGISQVRSLKLDSSIWTNELVELFLEVGNEKANSFWAANLPAEEELHQLASTEQRAIFHHRKYKERKYKRDFEGLKTQEKLNKDLCAAVFQPDVLTTMALVFSGADVMCATGDPEYYTPYLLAQKGGQRIQMEFLYHNQLSEFAKLDMVCDSEFPVDISSFMNGFLCCSVNMLKGTVDRKGRDDMLQCWCTLEGGYLTYYDNEKSATAIGRVDISEMSSLVINITETMTRSGALFTFEIYLQSEKSLLFGAPTAESQRAWVQTIIKSFSPTMVQCLLKNNCELIGRLYYKEGHDLYHWRKGWFSLVGSELFFCPEDKNNTEEVLQLKRLQELTVSTQSEGEEKIKVLLMVEGGRTIYIHCLTKQDFGLWHSAIQLAAGRDGKALSNQQLTKNDVPIIVDSCIAFITQYGLCHQGIYQKNGDPKRVAQLLEEFTKDARNVKLRIQDHQLEDVADTLKGFLSNCEDALLPKELYPYWISALDIENKLDRVEKYSTYIQNLPKISRSTLAALLQHLFRIQSCSYINQMKTYNLACVFSSCLFQTGGHTPQETSVVEDLINNYIQLFSVNEEQVKQMERENSCITRWKDITFSQAGDLIFEAYLEKKMPENCCLIKISPTMRAEELTDSTLEMKGLTPSSHALWTTFEVIETGELERPLHYNEKILEQVLEWSTLEDPSSAFLLIKKFPGSRISHSPPVLKEYTKGEQLKFKDGSSKLLSGHKFQDRFLVLGDKKLLLYKDAKSSKPEREVAVESVKCFLGVRKRLKPISMYFCCDGKDSQLDWVTAIIKHKHQDDLWPTYKAKSKPSDHQSSRGHDSTHRGSESTASKPSEEVKMLATSEKVGFKTLESEYKHRLAVLESSLMDQKQKMNSLPFSTIATSRGNSSFQRENIAIDGSPQTPFASSSKYPKRPQKKAVLECAPMPQNLLNELNSVLQDARRRAPKEES